MNVHSILELNVPPAKRIGGISGLFDPLIDKLVSLVGISSVIGGRLGDAQVYVLWGYEAGCRLGVRGRLGPWVTGVGRGIR